MTENTKDSETKIKVSEEVRKEIFLKIEDCYRSDVSEMIGGKKCWRRIGITFETMSKITVAVGGVLSFSSGYFGSSILSFISGSVSVTSLALLQFGTFGFKQGNKQASDLNILLNKLDLETIPVLEDEPDALINGNETKADDKRKSLKFSLAKKSGDNQPDLMLTENLPVQLDNYANEQFEIEMVTPSRKPKAKINNIIVTDDTENIHIDIKDTNENTNENTNTNENIKDVPVTTINVDSVV